MKDLQENSEKRLSLTGVFMKKTFLLAAFVTFSTFAMAKVETQQFMGQGLDGEICSAQIVRDGKQLLGLELKGAKKISGAVDDELNNTGSMIISNAAQSMHSFLDPRSPQRRKFILSQATIELKKLTRGEVIEIDFSKLSDQEVSTYDLSMYEFHQTKLSVDLKKDKNGNILSVTAKVKESGMNLPIRMTTDLFECK